uniref:Uncharacterized protein n=1 Tax=Anguilla anguilla TaxID=7936 RepID=A0A0E9UIF8_ANGAN
MTRYKLLRLEVKVMLFLCTQMTFTLLTRPLTFNSNTFYNTLVIYLVTK